MKIVLFYLFISFILETFYSFIVYAFYFLGHINSKHFIIFDILHVELIP